jgi:hypothetical protein
MKKMEQTLKAIREAEAELAFANPKRAAKLTNKIIKWKLSAQVWRE